MRLAVLADVHGNRWALEAVLDSMRQSAPDVVVNLGDCFFGPLDPAGTYEILGSTTWPTVRGNQDRELLSQTSVNPTATYTLESLGLDGTRWINHHTHESIGIASAYGCHGTPTSDVTPLLESVTEHGVATRSQAEIAQILGSVNPRSAAWQEEGEARADLVLCAHSHRPGVVQVGPNLLVVNPGSVGLPAYEDDAPYPHAMEAGSPHARWAILDRKKNQWEVTLVATPYDWDKASRVADKNGRPDWARWILKGRA